MQEIDLMQQSSTAINVTVGGPEDIFEPLHNQTVDETDTMEYDDTCEATIDEPAAPNNDTVALAVNSIFEEESLLDKQKETQPVDDNIPSVIPSVTPPRPATRSRSANVDGTRNDVKLLRLKAKALAVHKNSLIKQLNEVTELEKEVEEELNKQIEYEENRVKENERSTAKKRRRSISFNDTFDDDDDDRTESGSLYHPTAEDDVENDQALDKLTTADINNADQSVKYAVPSYVCPNCKKAFNERRYLFNHIKNKLCVKEAKNPKSVCDSAFRKPKRLPRRRIPRRNPVSLVTDTPATKPRSDHFICFVCRTATYYDSTEHTVMRSVKLICSACKTNFPDLSLDDNDTNKDKEKEKAYTCTVCPFRFADRDRFVRHIRTHIAVRPYVCSVCGKAFRNEKQAEKHLGTHLDYKVDCTVCSKRLNSSSLEEHMLCHSDQLDLMCSLCGKGFAHKNRLAAHMRYHNHTAERSYSCVYCSKTFVISSHLRDHITMHTGEKNYKCPVCEQDFRTYKLLKQHSIVHANKGELDENLMKKFRIK